MDLMTNIRQMFKGNKLKAFVIDDTNGGASKMAGSISSAKVSVDEYTDAQKLLFSLYTNRKYQVGIIHENGSKYRPQLLCQFIRQIDPNIKLFVCKDDAQLESLVLT